MAKIDGCQGLEELLGRMFAPAPKPKLPPKRKFRVEWWKPNPGVTTTWGRFSHSYKHFETEADALDFAAEHKEHKAKPQRWVAGKWQTIITEEERERYNRLYAEAKTRRESSVT